MRNFGIPGRPHMGEFSVWQYFTDGVGVERVRSYVDDEEAFRAFAHYTSSVGARMGVVERVIIVDGLDCIVAEWIKGRGIVWPAVEPRTAKGSLD